MKKSELLAKLYEDLEEYFNQEIDQNAVDFILERCLKYGMKPPQSGNDYEGYGSGDDYFCVSTPSYEWEPEDA